MSDTMDTHVDGAMTLYAAGDHAGAQAMCRTVLTVDPDNLRALYLYGTLLLQAGRAQEAIDILSRAVSAAPGFAGTRVNLGVALRAAGRLEEAARVYAEAIALDPGNADVHMNLGNCLKDMGRFAEAEAAYQQCLALKPGYALAYDNLGTALREQGRLDEALVALSKAVEIDPNLASACNNLGGTLLGMGHYTEAREILSRAVNLDPRDFRAHVNLADAERRLENYEEGARVATEAIRINPDFAEAYLVAGLCLTELVDYTNAAAHYRKALELKPDHADARYNLARCLRYLQRYDEAVIEFQKALELNPGFVEAHNALGALYQEIVDVDKALRHYERAIELDPEYVSARWNRALMHLTIGDYEQGFADFEWRSKLTHTNVDYPGIPKWSGEPLEGTRLFVRAEQGFGDTVQFVRFLPELKRAGARVTLECQPGLGNLLRDAGVCDIVTETDPNSPPDPSQFDRQVWLMSLPSILGTRFDTIPTDMPYLKAREDSTAEWKIKLDAIRADRGRGFLAGVVWAGSRKNINDHLRSMSMKQMEPLAEVDAITLISLQQGPPVTQMPQWNANGPLVVPTPVVRSFVDTAAMIMSLDVVITVDTVVAHIAGALGRPVWLMIPYGPDWRWSIDREDTPWYPSMRIFRQPTPGDWASVVENVKKALAEAAR